MLVVYTARAATFCTPVRPRAPPCPPAQPHPSPLAGVGSDRHDPRCTHDGGARIHHYPETKPNPEPNPEPEPEPKPEPEPELEPEPEPEPEPKSELEP